MHYYKVLHHLKLLCHWQPGTNLCKALPGEKYPNGDIAPQEQHGPNPFFAWKEPTSTWLYLTKADQALSYRPWGEKYTVVCIYAAEVSPPWRWWVILAIGNYGMDDIVRGRIGALVLFVHLA